MDRGSNTHFHYEAKPIKRLQWKGLEQNTSSNASMDDKRKDGRILWDGGGICIRVAPASEDEDEEYRKTSTERRPETRIEEVHKFANCTRDKNRRSPQIW